MRTFHTLATTLSAAVFLAACSSTPKAPEAVAPTPMPTKEPAKVDNRMVMPVVAVDPLDDPKGPLAQRSVYFDFDSYVIKPDYKQLTTAHSAYLESHKARKVVVQGNADERGGREYNLALGQKRAEAVRKALAAMGVSEAQMEAISFGKEKPKALGHDEASWSQNRRADIVYAGGGK